MTTADLIATPDPISENIVDFARSSAHSAEGSCEEYPENFYGANASRLRHFSNDDELSRETYKIWELDGSKWLQRNQYPLSKLFDGISLGSDGYQANISWGATQSRFAIRYGSIGQLVRLDENNLSPSTFRM